MPRTGHGQPWLNGRVVQVDHRRIWKKFDLKPHVQKAFKLSTDPQFVAKVVDVVGLYHNPPEEAVVLCVDEKAQIQAPDRSQPMFPMMPGTPERRTYDYLRHGITSLFAAFNIVDGTVIGELPHRHRAVEFKKFLVTIDKAVPAELDVHLVCDRCSKISTGTRFPGVEYLDTEDTLERQMRAISNLFLTRFIRMPLDRKDRVAMSVGLEVGVPFCDHRVAEYVYNVPWPAKTMDGREKSVLRRAVPDAEPDSVLWRPKSGYPSTQDPRYTASLQEQTREVLADSANPLFDLVDRRWLEHAVLLSRLRSDGGYASASTGYSICATGSTYTARLSN